jgi:hypothetical protein
MISFFSKTEFSLKMKARVGRGNEITNYKLFIFY